MGRQEKNARRAYHLRCNHNAVPWSKLESACLEVCLCEFASRESLTHDGVGMLMLMLMMLVWQGELES